MSEKHLGSAELFPTDSPLTSSEMIGRGEDASAVADRLAGGANLVIAGPRRTGKTTIGDAALTRLRKDGCYVATIDLFEMAGSAELAEALTLTVLANRSPLHKAIRRARETGRDLLETLSEATTIRARQDLGVEWELALVPHLARKEPAKALESALQLPERIAAADDRRLVLFLDEFQEIASGVFGKPEMLTKQMRAIFQRSRHVSILFAGSIEHLMREIFTPSDRALSQFGSFYELTPITARQWQDGIRRRLAKDHRAIRAEALSYLVRLGEGHPRSTMLLAQQAHLQALTERSEEIDSATVAGALTAALSSERPRQEQTLGRIRSLTRHAQVVAQRAAHGANLYADLAPQNARRAVDALHNAGIVQRGERTGTWAITDPLLRRYLQALPFGGRMVIENEGGAAVTAAGGGTATTR
jgi:hypothetical protein